MTTTHYLPAFVAVDGRHQIAACGAAILAAEHSPEPTCQACRDYLQADVAPASVEALFGTFDPSQVVAPPPDRDVVGEYLREMRRFK